MIRRYIILSSVLLSIFAYIIKHKNNVDISELYTMVKDEEENFKLSIKSGRNN